MLELAMVGGFPLLLYPSIRDEHPHYLDNFVSFHCYYVLLLGIAKVVKKILFPNLSALFCIFLPAFLFLTLHVGYVLDVNFVFHGYVLDVNFAFYGYVLEENLVFYGYVLEKCRIFAPSNQSLMKYV